MKCTQAHELIGELLEGTIREEDRRALEEHLESCPDCRDLLADFQEIKTQAAALPRIEPSAAVWPNVLNAVRRERRERSARAVLSVSWWDRLFAPGRPRYALAAALALVLVVGGALLILPSRKPVVAAASSGDGGEYAMAKLRRLKSITGLAIRALSDAAAGRQTGLDVKTMEALDRDLRTIDAVIASCREAVLRDPRNVEARVYLLGAYKGKVEFLENIIEAKKNRPLP